MTLKKDSNKIMTAGKKAALVILSVFLIILLSGGVYLYSLLSGIKQVDTTNPVDNPDYEETVPVQKTEQIERNVINIALFGLDRRGSEASRTDTIMIATIDKDTKQIKLSSLMRDMYVDIPGRGGNRINAAYAYGGPGLAINTINSNFNMDIKYYATVDFKGLQRLIEKLGGIDINVKQGEIEYLNEPLDELNRIDPADKAPHVTKAGMQHLNGKQAVAYMRIRYYGNGDYERTERQRAVLSQIFEKVKKAGVLKLPDIVSTVLPYIETNMPKTEILSLGAASVGFNAGIQQYRLPVNGLYKGEKIRGMSVLVPDIKANAQKLHEFIFGT
jgi:LCP family protein required for cell wall assembly